MLSLPPLFSIQLARINRKINPTPPSKKKSNFPNVLSTALTAKRSPKRAEGLVVVVVVVGGGVSKTLV